MKRIRILTPGEILLSEFIRPKGLTVYRVAKESGIPQPTLQLITSGKRTITAETALKLGLYFGVDAQFWLNLQSEHDLRLAKKQNQTPSESETMRTFECVQLKLEKLIPLPKDIPIIYLFGDTGAGKTCLVRHLLGTGAQNFPSVRRFRTTVTPTEFIITNESELRAAFIFKSQEEVSQLVLETLEKAVSDSLGAEDTDSGSDLGDLLGESPDQRFKLRCFLNESARASLAAEIKAQILPRVRSWIKTTFPNEPDETTTLALALEQFAPEIRSLQSKVISVIDERVRALCAIPPSSPYPESHAFADHDRAAFVAKLKEFLGSDEGCISPVLEKARVRGALRGSLLKSDIQVAVTDGEGIGHDAKEARVLSARHLDYFYLSDSLVLVEDSETPFTRGGLNAIGTIAAGGHLPKLTIAFSRLDKVQSDNDERASQIREVQKSLRNALNAMREDGTRVASEALNIRYFAHMNDSEPDAETKAEITAFLDQVMAAHGSSKAVFVTPRYDFELLAAHLAGATARLRHSWKEQILGANAAKWQTQKAFTKRMDWKQDEFRSLKPVAEFTEVFVKLLDPFLTKPQSWEKEITDAHKSQCLDHLKREFSNQILRYFRSVLLDQQHPDWNYAVTQISGPGSTPIRSRKILETIEDSAPELTGEDAKQFKDEIKQLIVSAIAACQA
jgi:addiction module HigA family antidote